MAVVDFLDHTVTRYRKSEALGTNNAVARTWTPSTGISAAIQRLDESWMGDGGGERPAGNFRGFAAAGTDIVEGDVVLITAGPVCTSEYLLVQSAYEPRGNHLELRLRATREDPTT